MVMDFPINPVVGQVYTSTEGVSYQWDGTAWVVGFVQPAGTGLDTLAGLLRQVRVLLQDTDSTSSSGFRYSDDSLVTDVNQGMLEMFRIRPDIFLENGFQIPQFDTSALAVPLVIEPQFVPSLIYYTVGLAQLRDDEATQDNRASAFLAKFSSMLAGLA